MVASKGVIAEEQRSFFKFSLIGSLLFFVISLLTAVSFLHDGYASETDFTMLIFAAVEFALSIFMAVLGFVVSKIRSRKFISQLESLNFCIERTTKTAVLNFPQPMLIATVGGAIQWHNTHMSEMVGRERLFGEFVQDIFTKVQFARFVEDEEPAPEEYVYNERTYLLTGKAVRINQDGIVDTLVALYFTDLTDLYDLRKKIDDMKIVVCSLAVDNYDEVFKFTPNNKHGSLAGEIDKCISEWVEKGKGIVTRYERDRFLILFEYASFEPLMNEKFSILNEVQKIKEENRIPVTVSIGVGRVGHSLQENEQISRTALEMALGRGGDQAVVKVVKGYQFYGAKSHEVEKSVKVKARVVSHALYDMVREAHNVIIMGHKNADADSFGASVGLFRAFLNIGVDAYIAIDKNVNNTQSILNPLMEKEEYRLRILSEDRAIGVAEKDTLLIVVDTHRPNMVEYKELLKIPKKIVLIDHHRRCEDFIENTVLTYHEPYASSSCELVTEILQYFEEGVTLEKCEVEALYSGIYLDTKGFTFKTGARTFEAASYLRRLGVDPISVRRLFRNDLKTYIQKAEIISNAKLYRENIAIATCEDMGADTQIVVAQAADELLNIKGVEAAFVLAVVGGRTIISGRSLDTMNVQVVLEKLGGGGHITIAGAQIRNSSIISAEMRLRAAIDEVLFDA